MFELTTFRAGDTVEFEEDFSSLGYSALDGWTAACSLYGPATKNFTVATDSAGFIFTLSAADSGALSAGTYGLICRVTKDAEVYTVFDGKITVTGTPASITDVRSTAQIICEGIETFWKTGNGADLTQAMSALGISVQYADPSEIRKLYTFWKARWDVEKAADRINRGQETGKTYYLRFG